MAACFLSPMATSNIGNGTPRLHSFPIPAAMMILLICGACKERCRKNESLTSSGLPKRLHPTTNGHELRFVRDVTRARLLKVSSSCANFPNPDGHGFLAFIRVHQCPSEVELFQLRLCRAKFIGG